MTRYVATAALLAVVFAAGWAARPGWPSGGALVRTDTVTLTAAGYEGRLAALAIERDGLRARLEGVTERMPEVVYRTDTLVVADTVLRFVNVDSRGRLSYELLSRADSLAYRPEIRSRVDVATCDDGYAIGADGSVACNSSRAGHLFLAATLSRRPTLGLTWRKSYRSPWEFGASYDGARVDAYVRRSLQLW